MGGSMLKQFGALLAWISGSVAGITAVLYTLGFIVTKSVDRVLGIGLEFTSRDPVVHIGRGGNVVMHTALIAILPALAVIAVAHAVRWGNARFGLADRPLLAGTYRLAAAAATPVTVVAIVVVALAGMGRFVAPALEVEGLLFATPEQACAVDGKLARAVVSQDREMLKDSYRNFAICVGLVAGLGVVAWTSLAAKENWIWLVFTGLAVFLVLVGTPIAYGTLMVRAFAPVVTVDPPAADPAIHMRLLARTDRGVLVWVEYQHKVQWINSARINSLIVGSDEPILAFDCPEIAPAQPGD